ncbi:hypothetical protein MANES_06G074200v8 [Manihot esculenta]|uniref:Uncharacterized protein n=1 Tax=Manihot esculenta TaxID=3983 RepID=A0A2C9VNV6_MANES|nr:hypothetical protein MANES_06G074200v8 [Manihot esculenta]
MASSSAFPSRCLSCNIIYLLFLLSLVATSSARPGITLTVDKRVFIQRENMKPAHRRLYETSFLYRSQMFNFLPKGVPIPPSGPSKRHNSVEN